MNIEEIQNTLKSWLEIVSGDRAVMEDEPRPALIRRTGYWIVSPPDEIVSVGEDYPTYVDGVETVIGRRNFTCVIKYVCRDQSAKRNARYWMEQARMSLKRTLVLEHFRDHGLGIIRLMPTVNYDAAHDDRIESIAAAQLKLTCAVRDVLGVDDIGTIDTVAVESDMDTPTDFADTIGPVP